jgi:hypothetical protein
MLDKVRPAGLATADRGNVGMRYGPHPLNSQNATPIQADTRPGAKSVVGRLRPSLRGEKSDAYPAIAVLNHHWRVIECAGGIQWILQRRRGDRWRSYWFCRTREALLRGAREHAAPIDGVAPAVLLRLPEWIGGAP